MRAGRPGIPMVCRDVLSIETAKVTRDGESLMPHKIDEPSPGSAARPSSAEKRSPARRGRQRKTERSNVMAIPTKRLNRHSHPLGRVDQVSLPYRSYMQITCLEMEKARRDMERKSAAGASR